MRCARPSTTAVLPTPGSPISTGLFLVRRESTWTTRRISASRPITGSILPSRASAVRSRPYFSSAWKLALGVRRCAPAGCRAPPRSRRRARPGVGAVRGQQVGDPGPAVLREPDEQVLGGHVVVAALPGEVLGGLRARGSVAGASDGLCDASRRWRSAARSAPASTSRASAARSTPTASSTAAAMPSPCASRARAGAAARPALWPSAAARRDGAGERLLALRGRAAGRPWLSFLDCEIGLDGAASPAVDGAGTDGARPLTRRVPVGRRRTARGQLRPGSAGSGLGASQASSDRRASELEDPLDAGEVDAVGGQPRTSRSRSMSRSGVAPAAPPVRPGDDQAEPVVLAQGLRVHAGELGGHRDDEDGWRRRAMAVRRPARLTTPHPPRRRR